MAPKKILKSKAHRIKPKINLFKSRWFWLFIFIVIIVGVALYFLLFYSGFQVKNVEISGNDKINTENLKLATLDYSQIPIINLGPIKLYSKSIFLVNTNNIDKNILEKFPEIEKSKTKKKLMQSIFIEISERRPIGIYCKNTEDECFFIDVAGVIFEPADLPSIDKTIIRQNIKNDLGLYVGEQLISQNIMLAIYKIQEILKNNFQINIKEATLASPVRLDVFTDKNWSAYFDLTDNANIDNQLKKINLLLSGEMPEDSMKNLKYMDLRPKDRAIICDNSICAK